MVSCSAASCVSFVQMQTFFYFKLMFPSEAETLTLNHTHTNCAGYSQWWNETNNFLVLVIDFSFSI